SVMHASQIESVNKSGADGAKSSTSKLGNLVPGPVDGINKANRDLVKYLYKTDNEKTEDMIQSVEKTTQLKREQVAYIGLAILGGLLCLRSIAFFLCNLIAFGYPAYASVKAVRTAEKDDDMKWVKYWTVFGVFSVIDTFAESILRFFPIYYLTKTVFLVHLYLPQTQGAEYLYLRYAEPLANRIDAWLAARNRPTTNAELK
ncbi:hypothetical protein PMAYCL1PPCAC_13461, partial [Pristionchus mayeri]